VEQIIHKRTYPELEMPQPPRMRLSPLLVIMFVLLVGFTVVNMGVRALAQFAVPPANPFPDYADVLPGQPVTALETRAFSCWNDYNYYHSHPENYDLTEESCILTPPDGVFSSIQVMRLQGVIRQTTFILRDNTLQVGDLEKLLDMPTLHSFYRTAYFFLPEDFVIAQTAGYIEHFSLFLPVWSISFTDIDLIT
jgi:hypothetical protein